MDHGRYFQPHLETGNCVDHGRYFQPHLETGNLCGSWQVFPSTFGNWKTVWIMEGISNHIWKLENCVDHGRYFQPHLETGNCVDPGQLASQMPADMVHNCLQIRIDPDSAC